MWTDLLWMIEPAPVPNPAPLWPLPTVKPGLWERSMGYKRPFHCDNLEVECDRWHAGIDLAGGRAGGHEVVACEDCTVVRTGSWWAGTHYVFVRTATLLCTYGGLNKSGLPSVGDTFKRGQKLGVMGTAYSGLHFELYKDDGRTRPSPWRIGEDLPTGLLSPVNYAQAAMGATLTRETIVQRHDALRELGFYVGPTLAPWTKASDTALRAAQTSLGLEADGKWGPKTEAAIDRAVGKVDVQQPSTGEPQPQPEASQTNWSWGRVAFAAGLGLGIYLVGRTYV